MTTRERVAALMPLVERMHRGHCWIKTPDGPRRLAQPFTEFMLAEHCAGRKAYGLCPIAPGESVTRVALLDLDSHDGATEWPEMLRVAGDLVFALRQEGLDPIPWRSSGGRGVHIYLLWDTPQDAHSVRQMLIGVLAMLGYANGTAGVVNKQIEVFPKQDAVPADGYGSMFILPLAGASELIGEEDGL